MRIPSGCSNLERLEIVDRVKGMIFGTILGDSLGLATEGMTQEQVRSVYSSGPILFGLDDDQETRGVGFLKDSYRSMFDDNDFGDDAEQQLLILQSIQENRGTFNYKDFAARFKLYTIEIWKSDSHSHYDNGALVRSALLGVPKFWDGTTVIQSASECCRITHPDPRSVMSCVIVSTLVAR
ncbi:ADP-ribosylation/Crystallin J1 [Spinellus fusiger]|nr:ADP-ribosylation/Crystallin J1 [Spinellus fusiger]